MSFLSRLASLFSRAPSVRYNVDGHDLWWPKEQLPVNVWTDGAFGDWSGLARSVVAGMRLDGAKLMYPVDLEQVARVSFFGNRNTFRSAIVIQPYELTTSPGDWRCTSDLRYDRRTGEMMNALVEWNVVRGDASNGKRLMHELGHCMGLGHCEGTVCRRW